VKSDGTVGGFGGKTTGKTVAKKIQMLRSEGVEVQDGKIMGFQKILFKF
jgi:hypothetical protein